jgi:hypothetical protein
LRATHLRIFNEDEDGHVSLKHATLSPTHTMNVCYTLYYLLLQQRPSEPGADLEIFPTAGADLETGGRVVKTKDEFLYHTAL